MLVAVVLFFVSCAGGLIHYGRMFSHSLDQLDERIGFGRPLTAKMRQAQVQANNWLERSDRLRARESELNRTSIRIVGAPGLTFKRQDSTRITFWFFSKRRSDLFEQRPAIC